MTFRTQEGDKIYREYRDKNVVAKDVCRFPCGAEGERAGMFWSMVLNEFPYDRLAVENTNYVVYMNRHASIEDMNVEERLERSMLIDRFMSEGYTILFNPKVNMSIPDHYHFHIFVRK